MWADQAAQLFIKSLTDGQSVLDIGGGADGNGFGSMCRKAGMQYDVFDWQRGQDWESHIPTSMIGKYDGVYMSHSLEHMLNTNNALKKIHLVLKLNGVLGITVPPMKQAIVGGHVTVWNAGLLLYNLIMANFDCEKAAVKTYGYNCSVVVRRKVIDDMPDLERDGGDITKLRRYFPFHADDGFDGQIKELNWRPV